MNWQGVTCIGQIWSVDTLFGYRGTRGGLSAAGEIVFELEIHYLEIHGLRGLVGVVFGLKIHDLDLKRIDETWCGWRNCMNGLGGTCSNQI